VLSDKLLVEELGTIKNLGSAQLSAGVLSCKGIAAKSGKSLSELRVRTDFKKGYKSSVEVMWKDAIHNLGSITWIGMFKGRQAFEKMADMANQCEDVFTIVVSKLEVPEMREVCGRNLLIGCSQEVQHGKKEEGTALFFGKVFFISFPTLGKQIIFHVLNKKLLGEKEI
jgi:hypothetical protein